MENIIYEVVDKFILPDNELPSRYNEIGDSLADAIEDVFKGSNIQYSIDDIATFSSPGKDCGIISIAFIENGDLHHMNFEWEEN